MKTVQDIQEEINSLLSLDRVGLSKTKEGKMALKKARERIQYLNKIKTYLETSPTEDFVFSEKKRLDKLITTLSSCSVPYADKYPSLSAEKKAQKEFLKKLGVPKHKEHLKNLKFILS